MRGTLQSSGAVVVALYVCAAAALPAQIQMVASDFAGPVRIFNTDMAVLELQEPRKDLPCTVTPSKALIGFDLKFHVGFEVNVPLRDLAGSENLLTILFRVRAEDRADSAIYFTQRVRVPQIEEEAKGDAFLQGSFDLGEGKYHVDWLMRDRSERVCSSYWDVEATLSARDRQMVLQVTPGVIRASDSEQFKEEPPVERAREEPPLNVKVLVNFAPQNALASTLQPIDTSALVSILRTISRDPRIGKFSLTAFNLQEQRVVFRQADADRIDFPALGEALRSLNLGTVDLKRLSQKHGDTEFLADLIKKEVGVPPHPDALIFAGPKAMLEQNVQPETLKEVGELDYPVFYMNYALNPQASPWRDSISHAVRFFKGYEFTISRPRDLWFAVTDMVSRIVRSKYGRRNAAVSGQ
jgi:hypothetical protein